MKEKKHGNWEKIVSGIKKHALSSEPGIDGILVTVGLCIIALLLCVVMKDNVYTDDRDGNADKSGRYSHRCIRQESV